MLITLNTFNHCMLPSFEFSFIRIFNYSIFSWSVYLIFLKGFQPLQLLFLLFRSFQKGISLLLDGHGFVKYNFNEFRRVDVFSITFTANGDGQVLSFRSLVSVSFLNSLTFKPVLHL